MTPGLGAFLPFWSIRFYVSEFVPLTRIDPDTGLETDIQFVQISKNEIVMHPKRRDQLVGELRLRDLEMDRWADDGGPR